MAYYLKVASLKGHNATEVQIREIEFFYRDEQIPISELSVVGYSSQYNSTTWAAKNIVDGNTNANQGWCCQNYKTIGAYIIIKSNRIFDKIKIYNGAQTSYAFKECSISTIESDTNPNVDSFWKLEIVRNEDNNDSYANGLNTYEEEIKGFKTRGEKTWTFGYTGNVQTFKASGGLYQIEVYGAQGGDSSWSYPAFGGLGGYSKGNILLDKDETINIYVGGKGGYQSGSNYPSGGWNGGGQGWRAGGGGGATDVRRRGTSLGHRIIVAGAGGGSNAVGGTYGQADGGYGGGATGRQGRATTNWGSGNWIAYGGTQTKGGWTSTGWNGAGTFGQGGRYYSSYIGGGGGGWYGGAAGAYHGGAGAGGSGYIDGMLDGIMYSGVNTGHGKCIIKQLMGIDNLKYNTPVHKEPVQITGTIDTFTNIKAGYKIFVGETQVIPPNNRPCVKYSTPYDMMELVPGELLEIGSNELTIHLYGENGEENRFVINVTRLNDSPSIAIDVSSDSIHKENVSLSAHLTDTELDLAKFKVVIGDEQFYPETGWSDHQQTPYIFNYAISNERFKVGENIIKIICQDIHGAETTVTQLINKIDEPPVLGDIKLQGKTISSSITDAEGDKIRYQIWVNESQVFPSNGWTRFMETPYNLIYTFPNSQVNIGDVNKIEVLVEDELGEISKWTTFVVIDYVGLMFTDVGGSFYSNDIGESIKRLEVDTVIAGENSKTYPIWVKNTTGFKMKNVVIYPKQRDLDEIDEKVLLSITEVPFESKKELKLPVDLSPGESCKFFARIETTLSALGGGVFELWTEGEPYEIEVSTNG